MIGVLALLCVYIISLLAITLATLAYILREFAVKLLEHTLHSRDHPDKYNRDSSW